MDIIFAGKRRGKGEPRHIYPALRAALGGRCRIYRYRTPLALKMCRWLHRRAAVVLIYGEDDIEAGRELEKIAKRIPCHLIFNGTATAELFGNKRRAYDTLSSAIPMPPPPIEGRPIISLDPEGTQRPVRVSGAQTEELSGRHNTTLINTIHTYRGRQYYICLRAMAVGGAMTAAYVRARPVEDGDPSVHNKNTPLDPDLIRHFHRTLVLPNWRAMQGICRNAEAIVGPGFYAWDILPEAETGRLYVCEGGFKLYDRSLPKHLAPILDKIPEIDFYDYSSTARAFAAIALTTPNPTTQHRRTAPRYS